MTPTSTIPPTTITTPQDSEVGRVLRDALLDHGLISVSGHGNSDSEWVARTGHAEATVLFRVAAGNAFVQDKTPMVSFELWLERPEKQS